MLDVGSGTGDVALLLAEMVGPDGAVISVDSNPSILETARERTRVSGYHNITFLAGDIREIALDGEFDAVAGCLVLMYLQDPTVAIRHTMNSLRPGGVVAFLETDLSTGFASTQTSPLLQKIGYWVKETFTRAGVDTQMGLKLYELYLAAGLQEPQMQVDAIIGGGADWAGYQYAEDTLRSMLPVMEKTGVATATEVELDTLANRWRAELNELNCAVLASVWIGV